MSWNDERAAFETRVRTGFMVPNAAAATPQNPAVPVQFPGTPLTPSTANPWIRMQLLPGDAKRISLGPHGTTRHQGLVVFQIFAPSGKGSATARALADQLAPLFREATFALRESGLIRCMQPALDERGQTQDGNWYQVNLTVPYERDTSST